MATSSSALQQASAAMFTPNGEVRLVPNEQFPDALKAGGELAVPMRDPKGELRYVRSSQVASATKAGGKVDFSGLPQPQHEGFFRALGSDLLGVAKGLISSVPMMGNPVTAPAIGAEMGTQIAADDLSRQQEGRSTAYRVAAPAAQVLTGVNARGMENAANNGDSAGVLGHAAAPVALSLAPVAVNGLLKAGVIQDAAAKVTPNRLRFPLGDAITKPRGTVLAEAATPQELKAYADANNIPLNAAQATEHNVPRNVQSVGERATIGGTAVKQQATEAQAAVSSHAQDLMNQFSPGTPDAGAAGVALRTQAEAALERELAQSEKNFAAVDKQAQGTAAVDLKPAQQEAAALLKKSSFVRQNYSKMDAGRASTILQQIVDGPDTAGFAEAQATRSRLIDETMHPDNIISKEAQGWMRRILGVVDQQMMDASRTSPQLESTFRAANEHWKGLQEDFNSPRSVLYQVLSEPDPNLIPQKLTQQGRIGGSPYKIELLDKYGIDKGPVKWAVTGDLLKKGFGLYDGGNTLSGYSDRFLQSVFAPDELSAVYKTGAIARSVKLNTNPSGTGVVNSAVSDVTEAAQGRFSIPGSKAMAAGLTNADFFNKWLMKNPAPPTSNAAAFHAWLQARHEAELGIGVVASEVGRRRSDE